MNDEKLPEPQQPSWLFDHNLIATDPALTNTAITFADLKAAMDQASAIPRPDFDAVICLRSGWQVLRENCQDGGFMEVNRIVGIPVYLRDTVAEAVTLALELREQGKRPKLFGKEFTSIDQPRT